MRKALIVGVNHYTHIKPLNGCVPDAFAVKSALERHADGTVNFANPRVLACTDAGTAFDRASLKDAVKELFNGDSEIALFYFAGHGYLEETGGYICTPECKDGDDGLSLNDLMIIANNSPAKNKVVVLDSCHSGAAAERPNSPKLSEIGDGMTVLTASTADQSAYEKQDGTAGVFTDLFVDALNGGAANLVGDITPGSIYAHIDQSLGPWSQRPVFKTNVKSFVSLRKATPPIALSDLQALATHFPRADFVFQLDPGYEPERNEEQRRDVSIPAPDKAKNAVFSVLQKYVKVNLVRPLGAEHMWHAAMQSKSCELTVLGQHYRELVAKGLI